MAAGLQARQPGSAGSASVQTGDRPADVDATLGNFQVGNEPHYPTISEKPVGALFMDGRGGAFEKRVVEPASPEPVSPLVRRPATPTIADASRRSIARTRPLVGVGLCECLV